MRRGTSGLNLLLAVDKPAGMTSHDVVMRVRRALGERRVGHAGTLDPAATGVMVVGVGQGTRLMGLLTAEEKSYLAGISFGTETDTDDAEGAVVRTADVPDALRDPSHAAEVLDGLVGEVDQVPPAYSAISVNGVRAYAQARAGESVELAARRVRIIAAQLLAVIDGDPLVWQAAFTVSKGTYIRSIARDLGRQEGTAAHLSELRRTSSGTVTLGQCHTLDEIAEAGADGIGALALDPVAALGLPVRHVSEGELPHVLNGRTLPPTGVVGPDGREVAPRDGERVVLVREGRLLGVWHAEPQGLRTTVNFPDGVSGVVG